MSAVTGSKSNALSLLKGAVIACALLAAGSAAAVTALHGDSVEATGQQSDVAFLAGHDIHVSSTSSDDVFAAGNTIRFDKATADHAFAAGETLHLNGVDMRALMLAGQTLDFDSGQAQNDVVAFGRDLSLQSNFKIGGTAVLMGRNVDLLAPVGRDLIVAGQDVRIDSAVTGNVRAEGRHLTIGPNARIGGDLNYRFDSIDISPQAVISGKRTILPARENGRAHWGSHKTTLAERIASDLWGAAMFAILALGLTALAPGLIGRSGVMVGRNPLVAGLIGLGTLIVGPIVALVLMITIVGAPLGAAVLIIAAALTFLGLAAAAAGIGFLGRRLSGRGTSGEAPTLGAKLGWTLLGVVVLCVLGALPYVGGWIWLIACIVGVGAVAARGRATTPAEAG